MSTVAEHIVDFLISIDVRRIYGITGDSLNAFTDAIRKRKNIEWISMRHEESAAFAASAEAQLSGSLTVCAGSCGPGNLHLINGLYDCHRSNAPVLAIAAQIPTVEIGSDYFQETHPERIFLECSHYCELVSQPEQIHKMLEIAVQKAISLRGVSILVIPGDIAWKKVKEQKKSKFFFSKTSYIYSADKNLDEIANALNKSKKTAILAGIGCFDARNELLELADRLKAPIVSTLRGKDILEYDNPFNVGLTGLIGTSAGYHALMDCDTLLMLGTDFPYRQFYPENATIIQVDIRGENIARRCPVDYAVVGDVKNVINGLLDKIHNKSERHFLDSALKQHQNDQADLAKYSVESPMGRPIHPQYLTKLISDLAAPDTVFTCDVGTPTIWAARYLKMNGRRKLLGSFKHGSMACALPLAIGAQLRSPEKQVISLSGDGGIAMLLGDLLTLNQFALPVKIIVFNNGAYSFVELEMKAAGILEFGTELKNPNFAKLAEAMGFMGIRVEHSNDLENSIKIALSHPGPALVEVLVDRYELSLPPKISASEVAGFSLYMLNSFLNGKGDQLIELARSNIINK